MAFFIMLSHILTETVLNEWINYKEKALKQDVINIRTEIWNNSGVLFVKSENSSVTTSKYWVPTVHWEFYDVI